MEERTTIPAQEFCNHHQIQISFIRSLHEYGLIQVQKSNENDYLPADQLPELEKMVRLHFDLHINIEGIEAIHHLLHRVEDLQRELHVLRSRLRLYEE